MAVYCKIKILQVKQLSCAREFDFPITCFTLKSHFLHGPDFIQLNYCIFLLKLRPFKNCSSNFHIIVKHVDVNIVVGDKKCSISILIVLLLTR